MAAPSSPSDTSLHGLLQTIRGMCTDEDSHTEIDAALAAAVEQAKRLEDVLTARKRSFDLAAEIIDAAEAQAVYSRADGAGGRWVSVALPVRLLDELAAEVS